MQKKSVKNQKRKNSLKHVDIYKAHLKKMKQKERKALISSLNKILKSRSSRDIWSVYNKMRGNVKESDETI